MKKKVPTIILIVISVFLSSLVFAQDLGKIAESNLSAAKGESLYIVGRYDEAVSPLENAIKIRPEHGRAHYDLALTYAKLGEKEKAIDLLSSYLEYIAQTKEWIGSMDKEYITKCKELFGELRGKTVSSQVPGEEHFIKAKEYYQSTMFNEAIKELNEAIKINPKYALAYLLRGAISTDGGNYDEALADFNKAIVIDPAQSNFYEARAGTYIRKGDFDKAISDYNKAIGINSNDAELFYGRGFSYDNNNNFDQAIADYNKAIEINPRYANAYNNRGLLYDKKGNYEKAISDCSKAIEINPDAAAYDSRANIYFHKQEYNKSWEDVHKVEALGKGDRIDREFLEKLKKATGREK